MNHRDTESTRKHDDGVKVFHSLSPRVSSVPLSFNRFHIDMRRH